MSLLLMIQTMAIDPSDSEMQKLVDELQSLREQYKQANRFNRRYILLQINEVKEQLSSRVGWSL